MLWGLKITDLAGWLGPIAALLVLFSSTNVFMFVLSKCAANFDSIRAHLKRTAFTWLCERVSEFAKASWYHTDNLGADAKFT